MSHNDYIHDLNNKLSILYCMLRCCKLGVIPPDEQIDAVTGRISEIVSGLHQHLNHGIPLAGVVIKTNQNDCHEFIELVRAKLQKIFSEIDLNFVSDQKSWEISHIAIDKKLLYQIIENAVENSYNASSKKIEIKLFKKDHEMSLELSDDGMGFDHQTAPIERLASKSTGTSIIRENMRIMNGQAVYSDNTPSGVTLRLIFPLIQPGS